MISVARAALGPRRARTSLRSLTFFLVGDVIVLVVLLVAHGARHSRQAMERRRRARASYSRAASERSTNSRIAGREAWNTDLKRNDLFRVAWMTASGSG